MIDPQGLVPIPPIRICLPIIGCVSGDGNHTGAIGAVDTMGDVANDAIYDVGTGAGNILSDAAILPHMALHENPDLVIQAIAQYAAQVLNGGGCEQDLYHSGVGVIPLIKDVAKTPVGITVGAITLGMALGTSMLLGANYFHNSLTQDNVGELGLTSNASGLPWNTALEQAPTYSKLYPETWKRWGNKGCYQHCPSFEAIDQSNTDMVNECEQLQIRYAPVAAAAATCEEAWDLVQDFMSVMNAAEGSRCRLKHCDRSTW